MSPCTHGRCQRLLTDAERFAIGDAGHRAGAGQVGRGALDRRVHLPAREDVVGELLGRELPVGEDRLARAAVADEAGEPQLPKTCRPA